MAQIFLLTTCVRAPGDTFGPATRTRKIWDTVTKEVLTEVTLDVPVCLFYSKPTNELVDSYYEGSFFREVYHDGEGGVTFSDNSGIVEVDPLPEFSPVLNIMPVHLKSLSALATHVRMRLWVEDELYSDNFELVLEVEHAKDKNGEVVFYLQDILRPFLDYFIPDISDNTVGDTVAPNLCKRYRIEYAEKFPNSETLIGSYYHESSDSSLFGPQYSPIEPPLVSGVSYKFVQETDDYYQYRSGAVRLARSPNLTRDINFFELINGELVRIEESTNSWDYIKTPPYVNVLVFRNPLTFYQGATRFFYLGGFNYLQFPEHIAFRPGFTRLLSVMPKSRHVLRNQFVPIYWLPTGNASIHSFFRQVHYSDGSTSGLIITQVSDIRKGEVKVLQINEAELWEHEEKEVRYISVLIGSDYIHLYLANPNSPHVREFYFVNSRGGLDSLITTGEATEELNIEREEVQKFIQKGYTSIDGEFSHTNIKARSRFSVATGFMDEEEYKAAREILYSPRVFLKVPSGFDGKPDYLIPINVEASNVPLKQDGNYLYSLSFEYRYAFNEISAFLEKKNYL